MRDFLSKPALLAALMLSGAPAYAAGQPDSQPKADAPEAEGAFDRIWAIPQLVEDDEADILNELRLIGRLHLDNYVLDSDVGDASDLVVRRARLGVEARLFEKLEAKVEADLDLEGGPLYSRLTDAYLAWKFSDAAELTVGKHSVKFTLEGATSSGDLLTIDRSNVANNLWFTEEYIPGLSLKGSSGAWSYNTGLFSGGRDNGEFGDFDGGTFWLGSVGRDFADQLGVKEAVVRADYVYNDPDPDSDFTRPFQNVAALVVMVDAGGWGVSGDVVLGDGFLGQSDVFGATLLPWVSLTDQLQLAGRYGYLKSEEPNGLRFARYENVVSQGRGDLYHELYAGLNYQIYGNKLKLQTGLTYANMRDRAGDGGAYDGVTWTTGFRLSW